jgi:hypothetical protein
MHYYIYDLSNRVDWINQLNAFPRNMQDIYYTPEYYEIYEKNGDGKAMCFVFIDGNNKAMYPFLINVIDQTKLGLNETYYDIEGAYGYNGVISTSYDINFISSFFKSFHDFCDQSKIIVEFTRFHPLLKNHLFSKKNSYFKLNRNTVALDLTKDLDIIWSKEYSSENRNMIRKGEKTLQVLIESSEESFLDFGNLYRENMRRINANEFYFFNDNYFKNFYKLFGDNIFLISSVDRLTNVKLSSVFIILYKDYAHYHLSARETLIKNNSSNNFALHYAIQFAKERGCKWFHFGGGNSLNSDDPLFRFKRNFSSQTFPFFISGYIHNQIYYDKLKNNFANKYPNINIEGKILFYKFIK